MLFCFLLVACLEICVGRPLKVISSSRKVKQIMDLMARINNALEFGEDNTVDERQQKTTEGKSNKSKNYCNTWLLSVSLSVCLCICLFSVSVSIS